MEDQARVRMKEKIKKLLKLAGNNPAEQEALSALLKAQELLMQYKIERHEIGEDEQEELKIIEAACIETANTQWLRILAGIFESNFGVIMFYRGRGNNNRPVYFGEEDKATICQTLYDYTAPWLNRKACAYATKMRNDKGIVKGVKQDFIVGFLAGLRDKFHDQIKANAECYALVITVPKEVTNQFEVMKQSFEGTMKDQPIYVHGLMEARAAGYQEGKNFNTNILGGGGKGDKPNMIGGKGR